MKTLVIAIGGNSLIKDGRHQSVSDQYAAVVETVRHVTDLLECGYRIVITHGNGPQVGFILLRSEHSRGILHEVPLDSIVADTQGALGYQIQQALENEFAPRRRELLTMQNDLKAKDEKLQKEGAVMSEADRANAEKTLRDQQREFSRRAGEFQDDASTRRNEEIGKVQRYLVQEIQGYANAQGFDLVLGDGVFFAKAPLDITANVLAVLNTKPATLPPSAPSKTPAAPAKSPTGINK